MFERPNAQIPIHRYVNLLRRATYNAQRERRRRSLGIGRLARRLARAIFGDASFARPILDPVARLWSRLRHLSRMAWVAILQPIPRAAFSWLLKRRQLIRRMSRYVIADGAYSSFGLRRLSYTLIALRIPIVSGLVRRLVHVAFVSALSTQMAVGHLANTLLLARLTNLAFRPYIRMRRLPVSFLYFQALFHCRQYSRIVAEVSYQEELNHHYLNHILGVSHLYSGNPERACGYFKRALVLNDRFYLDYRMMGRAYLLLGDERAAASCFETSVELEPNTVMAHQNYAGRYDIENYEPKAWELEQAGKLLLYDNYGQLAEDYFLLGRFDDSFTLYGRMIACQEELRSNLPPDLNRVLADLDPRFDPKRPTRLLPYEWVTQFGHIGLLDSYVKMARLGMYPNANHVLLAPAEKVANEHYLTYWDSFLTIVRQDDLVAELFPHQRAIGDNFMAYPAARGTAEPWTRAAARAQVAWADRKRGPLLRVNDADMQAGQEALAALGVPAGAWYVGLHVREGGYHGESSGDMSTHRNARIEDYFAAIKAVTDRGGYVIRLGDSTMRELPDVLQVVDYARSPQKSQQLDIFFCGTSRFVIGTTSGLTTACLSFGTPMLLVNCISNDWQLWSPDTDFIIKRVRDLRSERYLSLAETFSQPTQGYLINAHVMRRHGLQALPNTADEIAEAVSYKLDLMDGVRPAPNDNVELMKAYRAAMTHNPFMFGAARPVLPFLERHPELLAPRSRISTPREGPRRLALAGA